MNIYKEFEEQFEKTKKKVKNKFIMKIDYNFFEFGVSKYAQLIMENRNIKKTFRITDKQRKLLKFIHANFEKENKKGIMIVGNFGTGKTILVHAISLFIENLIKMRKFNKYLTFYKANDLLDLIIEKNDEYKKLTTAPLIIDDLGKEIVEINHYGTLKYPMITFFDDRYTNGSYTIVTSNLTKEAIKDKYSNYITSRFNEMFSIYELLDEDLRK